LKRVTSPPQFGGEAGRGGRLRAQFDPRRSGIEFSLSARNASS
jgi:hypothetical protein